MTLKEIKRNLLGNNRIKAAKLALGCAEVQRENRVFLWRKTKENMRIKLKPQTDPPFPLPWTEKTDLVLPRPQLLPIDRDPQALHWQWHHWADFDGL